MTPGELRDAFAKRIPILESYGKWVTDRVIIEVKKRLGKGYPKALFKIPPEHRVKDIDGLVEKASRPGKSYKAPLQEITDQVGTRFVVLLDRECKVLNEAIQSVQEWVYERAKDVEQIRAADPHHFDYESHHWVVRPKAELKLEDVTVPTDFTCEIQVRTLLQHAYAELAHATVYKPRTSAKPEIKRIVARGAALIETAGGVFSEVDHAISASSGKLDILLTQCCTWYVANVSEGEFLPSRYAFRIVDAYADLLTGIDWPQIEEFLRTKSWVAGVIKENIEKPLFNDPVITIAFWLVSELENDIIADWPHELSYLDPIFAKLNISTEIATH